MLDALIIYHLLKQKLRIKNGFTDYFLMLQLNVLELITMKRQLITLTTILE